MIARRLVPLSPSAITHDKLDFAVILLAVGTVALVNGQSLRALSQKFSVIMPRATAMSLVLRPPLASFPVRCLLRLFGELLFASGFNVDTAVVPRSKAPGSTNPPSPLPQTRSPQGSCRFQPSPEMFSQLCMALRGERRYVPSTPPIIGRVVLVAASGSYSAARITSSQN